MLMPTSHKWFPQVSFISFINGSYSPLLGPGLTFGSVLHRRQDSLDEVSARRKAATYIEKNINKK
jgi:hypothetical protein